MLLILVAAALARPPGLPVVEALPGGGYCWDDYCGWGWGCHYYAYSPMIVDPVTGTFSVNFNFVPAAEIQRTTLLLARGPRPVPRTVDVGGATASLARPTAGARRAP